jgi:hypothetical protein
MEPPRDADQSNPFHLKLDPDILHSALPALEIRASNSGTRSLRSVSRFEDAHRTMTAIAKSGRFCFVNQYLHRADATRRSFACSRKRMTCSRLTEGNPARKSSMDSPASR